MLISDDYRKQQQWLHENTVYGVASGQYAPLVSQIIDKLEVDELLDYGCGSRLTLLKSMRPKRRVRYQAYDPGVPQYCIDPVPSAMVACIDVLEHIEPEYLDNVLDHLRRLTAVVGFFSVHTGPAVKTLPDGRNAHLTQKPLSWWFPKFAARFDVHTMQRTNDGGYFICYPLDANGDLELLGTADDHQIVLASD